MKATISVTLLALITASAAAASCPSDSVQVGRICVDKYEASVWKIAPSNTTLIAAVQAGTITDASQLAGATRKGAVGDDYDPGCGDNAATCTRFYAVSIPGVIPSASITWFQALAACTNSGKRLLFNQEWTAAALGSPDPGPDNGTTDCKTAGTVAAVNTGSRSACVSSRGAFDMVGNLYEWVADWVPTPTACLGWGGFSNDFKCLAGASTTGGPNALVRGGAFSNGTDAGPLAVDSTPPSDSFGDFGFRCAREM